MMADSVDSRRRREIPQIIASDNRFGRSPPVMTNSGDRCRRRQIREIASWFHLFTIAFSTCPQLILPLSWMGCKKALPGPFSTVSLSGWIQTSSISTFASLTTFPYRADSKRSTACDKFEERQTKFWKIDKFTGLAVLEVVRNRGTRVPENSYRHCQPPPFQF
jgi:hypothetical protein